MPEEPNFYNSYGSADVTVSGMNAWGEAVGAGWGNYTFGYPAPHPENASAIRWQSQIITGYGGYNAKIGAVANAINNLGDAVGYWPSGPLAWPADFTLPHGQAVSLTVPLGYSPTSARAMDINGIGSIVGYATEIATGQVHLMRWAPAGANSWSVGETFFAPDGGTVYGYGISLEGLVVGRGRFTVGGSLRAFVTVDNGTLPLSDLGSLGGLESEARDVHDEGGVTGWAHNSAGRKRPFLAPVTLTTLAPAHELPPLNGTTVTTYQGQGRAVNRHGQVVGWLQNNALQSRAFRYTPGGYVSGGGSVSQDLNTLKLDNGLTPPSPGWTLTDAVSINDGEMMLGKGYYNGNSAGWILYRKLTE